MTKLPESHLRLAIALAALAGLVDVVAFLALGGFFASFMSGNTTRLAIGISANLSDASLAVSLIIAFVGGVVGATVIAHRAGPQRTVRLLSLVAGLILICAAIAKPYQATQLLLLAAAMGAINCVFDRGDGGAVGLTYMTGTLVRLGQGLAHWLMRDGEPAGWLRPALLWAGFVGGGLIGAGLYWRIGLGTLHVAGLSAAALALWQWWSDRRADPGLAPAEHQDDAHQDTGQG